MKAKTKLTFVTIQAPVGSLVIPPERIEKLFRKMFSAGMKNYKKHPDDNSYDEINFQEELKKIVNSLGKPEKKCTKQP